MKKRTRNQLDDDDSRDYVSLVFAKGSNTVPARGKDFFLFLNILGLVSRLQIRPQTQKKKAIGGKITKRRLFTIYKKTYPE